MGCVKKVLPWVIDPVGAAIKKTTGFGYTPGGFADTVLNPPKPPAPKAQPQPTIEPPKPPPPPPPWHPAPIQAQTPTARPQHEGTGAGASSDRTAGLLRRKAGPGKSLLG